jgi:NADH-quinone oxidoreductase subunit L
MVDHGAHDDGTAGYHPHESPLADAGAAGVLTLGAVAAGYPVPHMIHLAEEAGPAFWKGSDAFNEHLIHAMHDVPTWVKLAPFAV